MSKQRGDFTERFLALSKAHQEMIEVAIGRLLEGMTVYDAFYEFVPHLMSIEQLEAATQMD